MSLFDMGMVRSMVMVASAKIIICVVGFSVENHGHHQSLAVIVYVLFFSCRCMFEQVSEIMMR